MTPVSFVKSTEPYEVLMAPRRLVSHLVISSKWLPKTFIHIFNEYFRAKRHAPVFVIRLLYRTLKIRLS